IIDPLWGRAERVEGVGEVLVERVPMEEDDVIFVISNSGRNPEPLEVAMSARERGLKVVTVTSLRHSRSVESRHSSGKKLFELGDVVLDTGAPAGDATLSVDGVRPKVGAVSTVLGATILNAVMVEATKMIADAGEDPPVLMSANLDGSDEFNERIKARYPRVSLMMGTFG
ncbi:MAG: sugar isomerase domain-containing protein, partial [Anaerolineae bacterium]